MPRSFARLAMLSRALRTRAGRAFTRTKKDANHADRKVPTERAPSTLRSPGWRAEIRAAGCTPPTRARTARRARALLVPLASACPARRKATVVEDGACADAPVTGACEHLLIGKCSLVVEDRGARTCVRDQRIGPNVAWCIGPDIQRSIESNVNDEGVAHRGIAHRSNRRSSRHRRAHRSLPRRSSQHRLSRHRSLNPCLHRSAESERGRKPSEREKVSAMRAKNASRERTQIAPRKESTRIRAAPRFALRCRTCRTLLS